MLIMNAHPSEAVNPPGPTTREPFATNAIYEVKIDTDRDHVADIAYRVCFSDSSDGAQFAAVRRIEGKEAAANGDAGQLIFDGAQSCRSEARVTETGDCRFFAGWRSDPFFLDTKAP